MSRLRIVRFPLVRRAWRERKDGLAKYGLDWKGASDFSEPTWWCKIKKNKKNSPKSFIMLRNCINFCLENLELGALDYIPKRQFIRQYLEQGRGCRRTCSLYWVKFLFFFYLFLFAHGMNQCKQSTRSLQYFVK